MKDTYYTKESLANKLVSYIPENEYHNVIDFCIGEGDLIKAVKSRLADIKCYGIDLNNSAIVKLKQENPLWHLETCDFLDESHIEKCELTKTNKFDIIVLNPPFTCKGSTIHTVTFDQEVYFVSTAMQFLLQAVKYIHETSILLCILPISCAYSKKDQKIWKRLESMYNLTIHEELDKESFKNCNPSIALVELNNFQLKKNGKSEWVCLNYNKKVEIIRGTMPVNRVNDYKSDDGLPFVHTTNLLNNEIQNISEYLKPNRSQLSGPAVLISRVGNPREDKICRINSKSKVIISDCIIALKTEEDEDSTELEWLLKSNWNVLKSLYKGTAAKYITLERIRAFLYSDTSL